MTMLAAFVAAKRSLDDSLYIYFLNNIARVYQEQIVDGSNVGRLICRIWDTISDLDTNSGLNDIKTTGRSSMTPKEAR